MKNIFKENKKLKEENNKLKILETELQSMPKYNREPCKHCEYKIICEGECDKTLKPKEEE